MIFFNFQNSIGCFLIAISVSHWFPNGIHLLELLAAFAHFTLLLSLAMFLYGLIRKQIVAMLLSLISVVLCGALVIPSMIPSRLENGSADFTIGQMNIYHHNNDMQNALDFLSRTDVDILSLQELNAAWSDEVDRTLTKNLPYSIEIPWDTCCYGIGLFSKFPITDHRIVQVDGIPAILATVMVKDHPVTIVSLHTQAPAFPDRTDIRNEQLNMVMKAVSTIRNRYVVLGDFNIVPWNPVFRNFLSQSSLTVVRSGFQATFPMDVGIPLIPIDHVAYSDGLLPTACGVQNIPGSDHRAVVASFRCQ